jgi:hypothetical protein
MAPVAAEREPRPEGGVLDPVERLSEVLFGLIMALTFTGSIHAASEGREEIRTVLAGAIGCNIAWGIVDAVMYLMTDLVTRGRVRRALDGIRRATTTEEAVPILADVLPAGVVRAMKPADFEALHGWLVRQPEPPKRALTPGALRGAVGVFLLVTVSTFPVVVPFLFVQEPVTALRISHAVALAMLFGIGWALGKYSGLRPLLTGFSMLGLGVVLAAIALALGG